MNKKTILIIIGLLLIIVSFVIPESPTLPGEPVNTPSTIHLDSVILFLAGTALAIYGFIRKK